MLESDPALDRTDRYGRLLRYVKRNGLNVNLELARRGAAAPYFYGGDRGRYAGSLMRAAQSAKAAKRGLWGACPSTVLDPFSAVTDGPERSAHADDASERQVRPELLRRAAFRPLRPTSIARTFVPSASLPSRWSAPTRTASTATATGSAASS